MQRSMPTATKCVRGNEYTSFRVDLPKGEVVTAGELARGGASTVYYGEWAGRRVAVKRPKLATTADMDRFHSELGMLERLAGHKYMLTCVAARAHPPDYSFYFPLMENGTLESMLHEQRCAPTVTTVVVHAVELAEALAHMHAQGIVHRDVKPGNVLLDAEWRVKLGDFGLAAHVEELEASLQNAIYSSEDLEGKEVEARWVQSRRGRKAGGFQKQHMMGTMEYLAPEVLKRQVHRPSADVYAFGVTLCELCTGVLPYSDRERNVALAHTVLDMSYNEADLSKAIASEGLRPVPPSDEAAPRELREIIEACWAHDPADRPTMARVVERLRALANDLDPGGVDALKVFWRAPPPKQPSAAAAAEAAALAAALGGDPSPPPAAWLASAGAYAPEVGAGVVATSGARGIDRMEDAHAIATPLECPGNPGNVHFIGVFDGHRGAACARFAADAMPAALPRLWAGCESPAAALQKAFLAVDAAYVAKEEAEVAALPSGARPPAPAGCTALGVLVAGNTMAIANAGDCRAVLSRGGEAVALTNDHGPDVPAERARIEAAGGALQCHEGKWRVGAPRLAVSRALGDRDVKVCRLRARAQAARALRAAARNERCAQRIHAYVLGAPLTRAVGPDAVMLTLPLLPARGRDCPARVCAGRWCQCRAGVAHLRVERRGRLRHRGM